MFAAPWTVSNLTYLYESTRKSKQYRRNTIIERIQLTTLHKILFHAEIDFQGFILRIFYYQFSDQQREHLLKDYCAEFLTHVFTTQRSFNLRCSFQTVFDDSNLSIYDVVLASLYDRQQVSQFLVHILSLDATQFCSRFELTLQDTINEQDYHFYYVSSRYHEVDATFQTLQHGLQLHAVVPPLRIPLDHITKWIKLLEYQWDTFYADIHDRSLTVRCQSPHQSDLLTRRYFDNQEIVFDTYLDLVYAIQQHNIIEFIPNCHNLEYELQDVTIDFDTAKIQRFEDIKLISDLFEEFLNNKRLTYFHRLTGGKRGGQHFVVPIAFTRPILLAGRPITFERYVNHRKEHEILIDSAKDTFFSLCLLFQQEYANEPVVKQTTLHLRDPTERLHKMLFDIICGPQRGRRSVFSLHNNTGNFNVPIKYLPDSLQETNELCSFDFVFEHISEYAEDPHAWSMETRENNFYYLEKISTYAVNVLRDYYRLPAQQFNKKVFGYMS